MMATRWAALDRADGEVVRGESALPEPNPDAAWQWIRSLPQVVQPVAWLLFLRVVRARARYQPTARFSTWIYRIVFNMAVNDKWRSVRRFKQIFGLQIEGLHYLFITDFGILIVLIIFDDLFPGIVDLFIGGQKSNQGTNGKLGDMRARIESLEASRSDALKAINAAAWKILLAALTGTGGIGLLQHLHVVPEGRPAEATATCGSGA